LILTAGKMNILTTIMLTYIISESNPPYITLLNKIIFIYCETSGFVFILYIIKIVIYKHVK